jgi:hypothetical protein
MGSAHHEILEEELEEKELRKLPEWIAKLREAYRRKKKKDELRMT